MEPLRRRQLRQLAVRLSNVPGFIAIDWHLASLCSVSSRDEVHCELIFIVVAVLSRALREGHSCVLLSELAGRELDAFGAEENPSSGFTFPGFGQLRRAVEESDAIMSSADFMLGFETLSDVSAPLVYDGDDRLYAVRLFEHEVMLSARLIEFTRTQPELGPESAKWLEQRLQYYFPANAQLLRSSHLDTTEAPSPEMDWQKEAAHRAVCERLCIVSGGPGTGKTSTVVKILALVAELAVHQGRPLPRILLIAPTGKAAARLNESIQLALDRLGLSEDLSRVILPQAMTIHRALGVRADSATRYVHNQDYPLMADVVLIDEASMVDLALMRHVCDALRADARLIVLGDRHQLASVEAGSVFSELCAALKVEPQRNVTELKRSFRFSKDSGVARLAVAIRDGAGAEALALLALDRPDLDSFNSVGDSQALECLLQLCVARWQGAFSAVTPEQALSEYSTFRVLCAHRQGSYGIERLNQLIGQRLVETGKIASVRGLSRGQLVMILENDRSLGLSNGDIAVVWPDESGRLMACLSSDGGSVRRIAPAQLPSHELCFAMTVHKSQGSEHDAVAIVLPEASSPILSRELLYTAVTRAKEHVSIFADQEALKSAIGRAIVRRSGLAVLLRKGLSSPS